MKKSLGEKTLAYPTPVYIVSTYDPKGEPNAMNVAWGGICCSKPACLAISVREATYTFKNIRHREAFVVNIPSVSLLKEADYFGIVSGADTDKFEDTGLTPIKSQLVDAPLIQEFPINLECRLLKQVDIGLHTQFIGEIVDVKIDEEVLDAAGVPDIEKIQPFVFTPQLRDYYSLGHKVGKAFEDGKILFKKREK